MFCFFLIPFMSRLSSFFAFYACHSRILIVRARIAHGEINVFDGANFITITVTRIIKLCYCSAVCLPSSCELRATRHEDRQKTKDNSCHYLDRHKKSHEASPSTFFKHQIRSISCQQLLCSFWWKSRSFISRRHLRRKGPTKTHNTFPEIKYFDWATLIRRRYDTSLD